MNISKNLYKKAVKNVKKEYQRMTQVLALTEPSALVDVIGIRNMTESICQWAKREQHNNYKMATLMATIVCTSVYYSSDENGWVDSFQLPDFSTCLHFYKQIEKNIKKGKCCPLFWYTT